MQHLDDGLIQEIIDGEIPSPDLVLLQAHLAGCDVCRARLAAARAAATEADDLLVMLDEVEPASAHPEPVVLPIRRPHWSRNLAWAASLVLAVGLGYASRDVLDPIVPASLSVQEATGGEQPASDITNRAAADADAVGPVEEPVPPGQAPAATTATTATPEPRRDQANPPPTVGAGRPSNAELREQVLPQAAPPASGAGVAANAEGTRLRALGVAEREATDPRAEGRLTQPSPTAFERSPTQAGSLGLADAAKAMVAAREVDLPTAMRLLGGSIKLIDGMVPHRLDAAGNEVMVVYRVAQGELFLSQHRDGALLEWNLTAPPGFPTDSLAVLRTRVKP